MIKEYTLIALQKAINYALSLDDTSLNRIKKLDNKTLQIIILPLNISFFMLFKEQKIELLPNFNGKIDVSIKSNPIGLIKLSLLPSSKARSLFNDKIKISGDIELGQEIKKLFDNIDIDWESHLAQFTGDVAAHQIGSIFREGQVLKNRVINSMQRNITEYLQEEIIELPPKEEINDFFNDVDELSLRTERIAAHINKLLVEYESD